MVGMPTIVAKTAGVPFVFLLVPLSLLRYVLISCCLAPAVVVLEGLPWKKALRRSWQLIGGHRLRALSAIVLLSFLSEAVSFALMVVVTLFLLISMRFVNTHSSGFQTVVGFVFSVVVLGVLICLPIFLYFDIRCRKEAFHLETLREY